MASALFNRITGDFQLIGTITNSLGYVAGPNTNAVVYENAFSGICASLVYRLDAGSLDQDLVFTARMDPAEYSFPTNNVTLVQVITEIYEAPEPDVTRSPIFTETNQTLRAGMAAPDILDETLTFDPRLFLGLGHAYSSPTRAHTNGTAALVAKVFKRDQASGRLFLIESVPYGTIREAMEELPDCLPHGGEQGRLAPPNPAASAYASIPAPPAPAQAQARLPRSRATELAQLGKLPTGLVVDWQAQVTSTLGLLASDTTYWVAGAVTINNPLVIEAAVIKYQAGASLRLYGSVTCKTTSYRPAIFTAYTDNTIGEPLCTSNCTISPSGYAAPAIYMGQSSITLSHCRFRYAQKAIEYYGGGTGIAITVNHSQFLKCVQGIAVTGTGSGCGAGPTVVLNNSLMAETQYPLNLSGGVAGSLAFKTYNCTIDHPMQIIGGSWSQGFGMSATNAPSSTSAQPPATTPALTTASIGLIGAGPSAPRPSASRQVRRARIKPAFPATITSRPTAPSATPVPPPALPPRS